ncbi:MAG: HPr family phosphocarrier protein, partial [Gammaproteobacteria bacterium]
GQASADGMSLIELMLLGAKHGDTLTITADGKDATEALTALAKLVEDGFGENDDGNST